MASLASDFTKLNSLSTEMGSKFLELDTRLHTTIELTLLLPEDLPPTTTIALASYRWDTNLAMLKLATDYRKRLNALNIWNGHAQVVETAGTMLVGLIERCEKLREGIEGCVKALRESRMREKLELADSIEGKLREIVDEQN